MHLLAKRYVLWGSWSGFSEKREPRTFYLHQCGFFSLQLVFCLHICSLWVKPGKDLIMNTRSVRFHSFYCSLVGYWSHGNSISECMNCKYVLLVILLNLIFFFHHSCIVTIAGQKRIEQDNRVWEDTSTSLARTGRCGRDSPLIWHHESRWRWGGIFIHKHAVVITQRATLFMTHQTMECSTDSRTCDHVACASCADCKTTVSSCYSTYIPLNIYQMKATTDTRSDHEKKPVDPSFGTEKKKKRSSTCNSI